MKLHQIVGSIVVTRKRQGQQNKEHYLRQPPAKHAQVSTALTTEKWSETLRMQRVYISTFARKFQTYQIQMTGQSFYVYFRFFSALSAS